MRVEDIKGLTVKTRKFQNVYQGKAKIYDARVRRITYRRIKVPDNFKDKKVLILGDAFGIERKFLQKRGFKNITTTVASKKEVVGENVIICDIHNLPFDDEEFDFIYASHILEHAVAPMIALEEIYRIMKKGALALLWMPYHDRGQILYYHYSCFRPFVWWNLIQKSKFSKIREYENKDRSETGYFIRK